MKKIAMILSIAMVIMLFSGCSSNQPSDKSQETDSAEHGTITKLYSTNRLDWNYLVSTLNAPALYIDSLVEYDNLGICKPCLAESWERSEDGLTWTFKIRKGVKWMTTDLKEYAEVKAQDWVTSAEFILNAKNASMLPDLLYCLDGAEAYYNDTLEGKEGDFTSVGVKALDDYTLEYKLKEPIPYFLSSLTYKCWFPANAEFLKQAGSAFCTDNKTTLFCGEYVMTEFEPQGKIISVLNPTYWDAENMHIDKVVEIYNAEAETVGPEMFLRSEITMADVPAEQLDNWLNDESKSSLLRPNRPNFFTFYWQFNFYPNFTNEGPIKAANGKSYNLSNENWGLAVENVNFRKSLYHAFDKVQAIKVQEPYNAEAHVVNTITPPDFVSAEGVDYTQLGDLAKITNTPSFNAGEAIKYRDAAMKELEAAGAKFPIVVYIPYSADYEARRVQIMADQLEGVLNADGTEYIKVIYEAYASTNYSETTHRCGNFSIMCQPWGPDYADPKSYTDPFTLSMNPYNTLYMADGIAKSSDTEVKGALKGIDGKWYYDSIYQKKIDEANSNLADMNTRYTNFANLEAWLIDNCYVIPYMRGGTGYVASTLNPFESQYAEFGVSSSRYKYMHVYSEGMSTEEFNKKYEEWQNERSKKLEELANKGLIAGVDY